MDREALVVRRLRWLIGGLAAIGLVTVLAGYVPVTITDLDYHDHRELAGGALLALYVGALLAPAAWVAWRPRWPQLLIWIMWTVSISMLAGMLRLATGRAYEMIDPLWPPLAIFGGVAVLFLGICVALPLVRSTHRSPPLPRPTRLPVARVRLR